MTTDSTIYQADQLEFTSLAQFISVTVPEQDTTRRNDHAIWRILFQIYIQFQTNTRSLR